MNGPEGNDASHMEVTGPALAAEVRDPPIDVLVAEEAACIRMAAPGTSRADLRVVVRGHSLVVLGTRVYPSVPLGLRFVVAEIGIGPFRRRIELPWEPDPNGIEFSVDNGIVEIRVVPRRRRRAT